MQTSRLLTALLLVLGTAGAMAQTSTNTNANPNVGAGTVQRDVNQENRIEQGLQNGSLTTREAGKLEREESHIDRLQARDLRDGKLSLRERAQLRQAQNRASQDIRRDEANGATGDPQSASSQRMQADVQRNATQQARIEQGLQSGQLSAREAGRLERGQSRVDRDEAHAALNGHISQREQERIQHRENRQNEEIFRQKHDGQRLHKP